MKQLLGFACAGLLIALFPAILMAQTPQMFNYQAICRDNTGNILAGQQVILRFSLRDSAASGSILYRETQTAQTNNFGLVNLSVGAGVADSGDFALIPWGMGDKFLEVELKSGTVFQSMGVQQLLSVPFALYSANGGTVGPQGPAGSQGPTGPQGQQGPAGPQGSIGPQGPDGSCDNIMSGDGRIVIYNATNAYGYGTHSTGGSIWNSTSLSGTVAGSIASDSNIVIYTDTHAYGFGRTSTGTSGWASQTLSGPVLGAVAGSGKIVIYTAGNAYGFAVNFAGTSSWHPVTLNGSVTGSKDARNRIVVYTPTNAYGFGQKSTGGNEWLSTSLSAPPVDIIGTK